MVIDTDIFIHILRGHEKARVFLNDIETYYISDMTYMELVQGTKNKREFRLFVEMLNDMEVVRIPLSPEISQKASELVETYAHSHSVHAADSLIAATALVQGLPLVTGNIKHFEPIHGLRIHKFYPN